MAFSPFCGLNQEQQAIWDMTRQFAESELKPFAAQWDQSSHFPVETLRKAAALGLAGIYVPEPQGGSGLSRLDAVLIFEALSQGCVSTAAYLSIHNMVTYLVAQHADPNLQAEWLPKLLSMEVLSSYCLTEPQAGSDAGSLQTSALKKGDHYVLNGSKAFISGAGISGLYCVMAKTQPQSGSKGISCFLVPQNTPGLSFGEKEKKMGWKSQPTSMVYFSECQIPDSHLVGGEGDGFKIALEALNGGRLNIAACSLGGAQFCMAQTKHHLKNRKQFQKPLSEFQALQFKMADHLTHFEAARLLLFKAAMKVDSQAPDAPLYAAMAKRLATDTAFEIANQCLQLHGGYGYLQDYSIERIFRDLRVHPILEGTNEIMRLIIARHLFAVDFEFTH